MVLELNGKGWCDVPSSLLIRDEAEEEDDESELGEGDVTFF